MQTTNYFNFGSKNDQAFMDFIKQVGGKGLEFEIRFGSYTYDRERKHFNFHSSVDVDFCMRLKKSMNHQNIPKMYINTLEYIVPHANGKATFRKIINLETGEETFLQKNPLRKYNVVDYDIRFALSAEQPTENLNPKLFENSECFSREKKRTRYTLEFGWLDITEVKQTDSKASHYEVELEIKDKTKIGMVYAFTQFMLQTRQNNFFITSYFERRNVITEYRQLVSAPFFVGAQPETLHKDQISKLYKEQYSVTDKADGERAFMVITNTKMVYLLDTNMQKVSKTDIVSPIHFSCILDGELMVENNMYVFKVFDLLCFDGQDIRGIVEYNLIKRLDQARGIVNSLKASPMYTVVMKEFHYKNVFLGAQVILDRVEAEGLPNDGLIFTPMNEPYPKSKKWSNLLKWKPASQNTIDFYAVKDTTETDVWQLYVQHTPETKRNPGEKVFTRPVLFDIEKLAGPQDGNPCTYITKIPQNMIDPSTGEPFQSNTVIEFKWDKEEKCFVPLRTRWDKTVNPRKHGNFSKVACDIWYSIHNPIDKDFLLKFNNLDNHDTHFERMRKFHNKIKEHLYNKYCRGTSSLLELCSGKGGDLYKWYHNDIKLVQGYDICEKSVEEGKRRLGQLESRAGKLDYHFNVLDLSTEKAAHVVKSISKQQTKGHGYDVICCQFGIHYFFGSQDCLKNVLSIVKDNLKASGVFIITFMDANCISNLMKGQNQISKQVDNETVYLLQTPTQPLGLYGNKLKISLNGNNYLGSGSEEYIIDFGRFTTVMQEFGFECADSQLFKDFYANCISSGQHDIQCQVDLTQVEQDISFLNRYAVFVKSDSHSQPSVSLSNGVSVVQEGKPKVHNIIDLHANNLTAIRVNDVYDIIDVLNCIQYKHCKHNFINQDIEKMEDLELLFKKDLNGLYTPVYVQDPATLESWKDIGMNMFDGLLYFTSFTMTIERKETQAPMDGEGDTGPQEYTNWYLLFYKNKIFFNATDVLVNIPINEQTQVDTVSQLRIEFEQAKNSNKLTVKLLKELLKKAGLKTTGNKEELQQRLIGAF
jgi:SAM-dependent methyltransferase